MKFISGALISGTAPPDGELRELCHLKKETQFYQNMNDKGNKRLDERNDDLHDLPFSTPTQSA